MSNRASAKRFEMHRNRCAKPAWTTGHVRVSYAVRLWLSAERSIEGAVFPVTQRDPPFGQKTCPPLAADLGGLKAVRGQRPACRTTLALT